MKNIITILFTLIVCCSLSNLTIAQGTLGEYPGAGVGFDSGCGYPDAGNSDPGVADVGLTGNVCGSAFDVSFGAWAETGGGFDITGFNLNNFDIDDEAVYGIRLFFGPQNNCCTICLDAVVNLGQGAACGTFGPQLDLSAFGIPVPASYGLDIFGEEIIPYADMCPNTEYFAQYQFVLATSDDTTDPDGNFCALDDATITNAGTQTTVQTLVAPGMRDPIVINSATLTAAAAADCGSTDVLLDFTADITAGCTVSFGTCSQGLEFEFRAALACADGAALDITTGPLVNDPMGCFVGAALSGQISLGAAADVCAIYECDPNAELELYATYTFCEADDINGDGTGNDEAVATVSIASIIAGFDAAMCCNVVAACPEFNAVTYGPACNGYDICIGYIDTDQDGIGDAGEDPTGITMTVNDGIATSTGQTPINDGIFFFDADGDDVNDAVGYCLTVLFDNPTCDPEPYTPLVNLLCADGTPGMLQGGTPLTDFDILAVAFGIPGGTAIYPPLVGIITPPVCPMLEDGSDAVAGNVEVFVADANGDPTATSCLVVPGEVPACETAGGDAATVVQWNPTNDPLLVAVFGGMDTYGCGLNATADLSFDCPACMGAAACDPYNAIVVGPACDGYEVCIGYTDDLGLDPTGGSVTVTEGSGLTPTVINDGMTVMTFDADGDGTNDAMGFCYTVALANETCDPVPYTPLVTATCPDGTPATYVNGDALTDYDYLAGIFGIAGGTAAYPPLVGLITAPVCPLAEDGSDAVAGNVEVFVADANGDPTATSCLVVTGDTPACETAGGDAATPVQWNPTNDPLLVVVLGGMDTYGCGLNATADLSFDCPVCGGDPPTACVSDPVTATPAETCENLGFQIEIDPACVTDGSFDVYPTDGTTGTSGWIAFNYVDANGFFTNCPAGSTAIDVLANLNPPAGTAGFVFFGESNAANGGGCSPVEIGAFVNPTCEPATIPICLLNGDVDTFVVGFDTDGDGVLDIACDVYETSVTVYPTLTVATTPSTDCGEVTATVSAVDGNGDPVDCTPTDGSATQTCTVNGDLTFDFSGAFTDPLGCSTLSATAACSGCGDDPVPCEITAAVSSIDCDDMGTPEDGSDDTEVVTLTITSTGPWTAGDGTTGVSGDTYTFPATVTGGTIMMMFSVDGEADCNTTFTYIVVGCDTPAIPTLSQWGLMILALLMMTFGALKIGSISLSSVRKS